MKILMYDELSEAQRYLALHRWARAEKAKETAINMKKKVTWSWVTIGLELLEVVGVNIRAIVGITL